MKVVVLMGSARRQGHTAHMAGAFAEGAREAGHEVTVFEVATMDIHGCRGCEWCHTKGDGACIQKDDMGQILEIWDQMDVLVLASPIYYGSISGQLACALHRTYALGIPRRCRKTALLLSSGSHGVYDASRSIYKGFVQGYFGTEDLGIYTAVGSEAEGPRMQGQLRELGRTL